MRSSKPKTKSVVLVLLIVALLWLAAGTIVILKVRDYIDRNRISQTETTYESDIDDEDGQAGQPEDGSEDTTDFDENEKDDDLADEDEEPDEDEEDDEEDDYIVMVVNAPDGFAAVRTGRGVQFEEVGRINNGRKAYLTDLENGWYKIAKGKYKGYYTHESSYTAG